MQNVKVTTINRFHLNQSRTNLSEGLTGGNNLSEGGAKCGCHSWFDLFVLYCFSTPFKSVSQQKGLSKVNIKLHNFQSFPSQSIPHEPVGRNDGRKRCIGSKTDWAFGTLVPIGVTGWVLRGSACEYIKVISINRFHLNQSRTNLSEGMTGGNNLSEERWKKAWGRRHAAGLA